MLKTLSKREIKASILHLKVIRSSIALVLSLMFRIGTTICSVSQGSKEQQLIKDKLVTLKKTVVKIMHDFLKTWIKRVVGSVFGSMPSREKTISSRLNKETKVCDNYAVVTF